MVLFLSDKGEKDDLTGMRTTPMDRRVKNILEVKKAVNGKVNPALQAT
jgi:hypothetical protein